MGFFKKHTTSLFLQNIFVVASGNTIAKAIGIISMPLITRLYTPEEFGVFTSFMAVFGVLGSLATLRYSAAVPLAKTERQADGLLQLCFLIAGLWGVILLSIVAFAGNEILDIFNFQELAPFLWFLPLLVCLKGIYEGLNQWGVRHKFFKLVTRTEISKSTGTASTKLILGWLGYTPIGLFWGITVQQLAGIFSLFSRLKKLRSDKIRIVSKPKIKYGIRYYKRFPLFQSWSQLLLALGTQLPVLILAALYNAEVVGVFGLANTIVAVPMLLIGQSVGMVYYAEIARIGTKNLRKIYTLSISIVKKMFFMALIAALVLIVFGPWMFAFVFGAEWREAGIYSQFLAIILLTQFLSRPLANLYNLLNKQNIQLVINIVRVLLLGILFLAAKFFLFPPLYTIGAYSVLMMCFNGALSLLIFRILKRQIRENA